MNTEETNHFDIVIPVYNEDPQLLSTLIDQLVAKRPVDIVFNIIVVDDGSTVEYSPSIFSTPNCDCIRHQQNQGYGSALKTGILAGNSPRIAIIDADGTYGVDDLIALLEESTKRDMVVGIRTGDINQTPLLRKIPKMILNIFASYFAEQKIEDLNSGLRIFSRELAYSLWNLFPKGFSFTSTLTLGALLGGFRITNISINYSKRSGKSSIKPIRDTIRFFYYAMRLGLLFYPMKIFAPISIFLFSVGATKGFLRDYFVNGYIGNLSIMLMLAGLQLFMMGLIALLIVHGRGIKPKFSQSEIPQIKNGE